MSLQERVCLRAPHPLFFLFFSYCVFHLNAEKVLEYEKGGKEEFLKSAAK